MGSNDPSWSRRRTIQAMGSTFGLAAIPVASSKTRAANRGLSNSDFQVNNEKITYDGPDSIQLENGNTLDMSEFVSGMNAAQRNGEVTFSTQNGQPVVQSTSTAQPDQVIGPSGRGSGCPGVSNFRQNGTFKYLILLNDCDATELRNKLAVAAAGFQIAAVISGAVGAIPVAAAAEIGAILAGTAATLITANNDGRGIRVRIGGNNVFRIKSQ